MSQETYTFPHIIFTSDTAFAVMRVMLQCMGIDLTKPLRCYRKEHRFSKPEPPHTASLHFVFDLDGWDMPKLAITSAGNMPLLTLEFGFEGITVTTYDMTTDQNVVILDRCRWTTVGETLVRRMLETARAYIADHSSHMVHVT